GKGLTNFQAAGIVGNLDQESNVDPNAVQAGGPGRGIAQWSVGGRWDTDAGDNAVAYAAGKGVSVDSLNLQLDFIWYELTNFGYGLSALRATTNVTDATVVFQDDFEGCGTCDQTNRVNYAKAVLAAYGSIPFAAGYVSQSWPLATTAMKMKAGQVVAASITLKNNGTHAWDSKTKLGTTEPRDRASDFADSTWLSASRPAGVTGSVAPGGTFKFEFNFKAPDKPGTYDEFFGVVEEGVAWFSDPGQGGPVDNQIEVKFVVTESDGGGVDDDGGPYVIVGDDGGLEAPAPAPGSGVSPSDDGSSASTDSGCSVSRSPGNSGGSYAFVLVGLFVACTRRRRSRRS
ncbi:MAG: phage tail tip lysozyme, partial [Polyangiaceae bacterium]